MNPQGERRTEDQVLALAPDAASRKAGARLGVPGPWSGAGARAKGGAGAVWGECRGSGSTPYRTVVDLADEAGPGFHCTCPSRKFPCKHALGLLLLWSAGGEAVPATAEDPPAWAGAWLDRRRQRARTAPEAVEGPGGGPGKPAADGESARRRADRRAQRMAAGAVELEQRLVDLLRHGLAAAEGSAYGHWEETAARMVDAQAPGLASRARELAPLSGAAGASRLLEECALLHALNQGFLQADRLPGPLAATVRSRVGVSTGAAAVLASAAPVRDRWLVLAQQDGDDGRLITRRIWLRGTATGRMALLLSYDGGGKAPELSLPAGLVLDADLAFHPSARPLRAVLGTRHAPPAPSLAPPPGGGAEAALRAYGEALRDDPWLDAWPVVLSGVVPVPDPEHGWQLADADGESALPVDPRCSDRTGLWQLAAISGGGPVTVFGECGHRGFAPLATWAPELVTL
ncbi:SWIM zinc finger family protein [Streptoverticillium reticulum]|uniref:SWIM zinc finger family protein n=1 Tax=Streptoverticillium reticulum TaxID=1433415 RepID=UPI0039BEE482